MENNSLYLENKLPFAHKDKQKKSVVAAGMLVVLAAFLLFLAGLWWWPHPLLYTFLPLVFLAGGVAHILFMQKYLPRLGLSRRWLFTAFLSFLAFGLLAITSIWDESLSLSTMLASGCAFFLPFTVVELWQAYADLSFSNARYWQLSIEAADELPAIYLKSIKVRFKVIQEPAVNGMGIIPVTASARMSLSDVFYAMVQKQNKGGGGHIALRSRELEPFTWVFYKMDFYFWYRILDPEKSMQDNGIGKNALIYAQRVSGEAFEESIDKQTKLSQ